MNKLIQPDVAQAFTLPSHYYFDPSFEGLEKKIFAGTWQIVGHVRQLPNPGSFFTTNLVGEPLLIVRNAGGEIKGFYNVCKHRAGPPAEGCGERKVFRCGYHGWTYSLDGELLNTPECEGVEDFRQQEFGLTPVRTEQWAGLIFVNLNPKAEPLLQTLDQLPQGMTRFQFEKMQLHERRTYEMQLEDLYRQLSRGISPAERASRTESRAGLRQLHHAAFSQLFVAIQPHPRP